MISRSKSGDTVLLSLRIPAFVLYGRWFMEDIQGLGDGPALVGGVCIPSACGAVIGAWNVRDAKNGGKARVNITLMNVEDVLDWPVSEEAEYALWTVGHSKGDGKKLRLIGEGWHGSLAFALEKGECEAVIVGKVWMVKERQVAVIGLLDKFGSLAGLQSGVKDDELVIQTRFETDELSILVFGEDVGIRLTIDGQKLASTSVSEDEVEGGRVISFPVKRTG